MLRDKRANRLLELDVQEYFPDRIMVGFTSPGAVVGQYSFIDLYNDGTTGARLLLYDFTILAAANQAVYVAPIAGHGGTIATSGIALNPEHQVRQGKLYVQAAAALPTSAYIIPVNSGGNYQWEHEWPIAEIIPGFSLRFALSVVNTIFTMSFLWMIEPDS